jgi:hypothetical protein
LPGRTTAASIWRGSERRSAARSTSAGAANWMVTAWPSRLTVNPTFFGQSKTRRPYSALRPTRTGSVAGPTGGDSMPVGAATGSGCLAGAGAGRVRETGACAAGGAPAPAVAGAGLSPAGRRSTTTRLPVVKLCIR